MRNRKTEKIKFQLDKFLVLIPNKLIIPNYVTAATNNSILVLLELKFESAAKGRERVRTLYQSEDPKPPQPVEGRKRVNSLKQKDRAD